VIESISIRNLGVISQANLEFGPGFNVLTGETGAGKTMVLTALNLLLGGRADTGAIRSGESQLSVSGIWRVSDKTLMDALLELGADLTDNQLVVSRSLTSDGRSRAVLGGVSVPVSTLAQFAEQLVAVHGQADQLRLRSGSHQREALDEFGDCHRELSAYQSLYRQYRELESRLERLSGLSAESSYRIDMIREQISSVERLNPGIGELSELTDQITRLSNVEGLRAAAVLAHDALSSDAELDVIQLLGVARKALEHAPDPALQQLAARLLDVSSVAQDAAADIASYLHDLDADPRALEALMERKAALVALERRYGESVDQLLENLPALHAELLDLDSSDEQIEKLEMQKEALLSQLAMAAKALTESRIAAANALSQRVSAELGQLAMSGSQVVIRVSELSDFTESGIDRVEFLLSAFAGAEPRPLSKGASGGELSRIMLAIELVLAARGVLPTMIFDEVDAGVGGQAATELGRRLALLAGSTQVLVVTHLAQVAAFGNHQIRVLKNSAGAVTESSVALLSTAEREVELARMLSGTPDSQVAIEHARELLRSV
jgi:DNA repair protein RecN (Recombination protein N)